MSILRDSAPKLSPSTEYDADGVGGAISSIQPVALKAGDAKLHSQLDFLRWAHEACQAMRALDVAMQSAPTNSAKMLRPEWTASVVPLMRCMSAASARLSRDDLEGLFSEDDSVEMHIGALDCLSLDGHRVLTEMQRMGDNVIKPLLERWCEEMTRMTGTINQQCPAWEHLADQDPRCVYPPGTNLRPHHDTPSNQPRPNRGK